MTRSANDVLEQEYLQVRAKILEVGAFFDRLNQAAPAEIDDEKLALLKGASEILNDDSAGKAERIQMLFSRSYEPAWREQFGL